jgi:hypothetical protein
MLDIWLQCDLLSILTVNRSGIKFSLICVYLVYIFCWVSAVYHCNSNIIFLKNLLRNVAFLCGH